MADDQKILSAIGQMMVKVDQRFEQIQTNFDTIRDDVFTKMDEVYKEVVAMRQEQASHQAQHDEVNSRLDKIEKIPSIAHELKNQN